MKVYHKVFQAIKKLQQTQNVTHVWQTQQIIFNPCKFPFKLFKQKICQNFEWTKSQTSIFTLAMSERLFSLFLQSVTLILASVLALLSDNKLENSIRVLWRLSNEARSREQTSWWILLAVDKRTPGSRQPLLDERWKRKRDHNYFTNSYML